MARPEGLLARCARGRRLTPASCAAPANPQTYVGQSHSWHNQIGPYTSTPRDHIWEGYWSGHAFSVRAYLFSFLWHSMQFSGGFFALALSALWQSMHVPDCAVGLWNAA